LGFFGVGSVESWRKMWVAPAAQYRGKTVQEKRPGFAAAWLRIGEVMAQEEQCEPFDAREFRRALAEIRELTVEPATTWRERMRCLCRAAGVAVVFTREIPRASVSGATRWLTKDKAVIQLSLKYRTDDHLWFTFFHESAHVLLHGKKHVFLTYSKKQTSPTHDDPHEEEEEREANRFAQDILIPPSAAQRLPFLRGKVQIRQFAASINVAPGIVVGRLQRENLLPPSHCNDLKRKFDWAKASK
jgi:Zn-dependent peptidase ImmA (M78 family)